MPAAKKFGEPAMEPKYPAYYVGFEERTNQEGIFTIKTFFWVPGDPLYLTKFGIIIDPGPYRGLAPTLDLELWGCQGDLVKLVQSDITEYLSTPGTLGQLFPEFLEVLGRAKVQGDFDPTATCAPDVEVNCENPATIFSELERVLGKMFEFQGTFTGFPPFSVVRGKLPIYFEAA
jgi:hypothetical protein